MRKLTLLVMALVLIMSLSVGILGCGGEEQEPANGNDEPKPTLPSTIVITTTGLGSAAHGWSSVLGDTFASQLKMSVRQIPHGTDVARYTVLRDGDAELVAASSINGWAPTFGLDEFSDWGPQPIYMVWQGSTLGTGVAVKADSDIETMADLAGKKVNFVPGMPSINRGLEAHLAFAGLTWDDVVKVDFPSYGAVMDGLKLGTVDAAGVIALTAAGAHDIASAPGGIKWLPMPADDTAGWQRLSQIAPYVPQVATHGAGIAEGESVQTSALTNNIYSYGIEVVDEVLAYHLAKVIHTQWEAYKDRHPNLPGFTVENALNFQFSAYPYHPGTIKYFKEIGMWTAEHDAWQADILAAMNARI